MSDKKLNFAKQNFSDKDLEELPLKGEAYPYEEVDFSQNGLSTAGLRKVLDLCVKCEKLKVLKLFRNDIDDDGAEELAAFVRKSSTIEELHLSHNKFTQRGVTAIVSAADESREKDRDPLWLRVEQNSVKDPEQVLKELDEKFSICTAGMKGGKEARGSKVHMTFFLLQRGIPQNKYDFDGGKRKQDWAQDNRWDDWDSGKGGKGGKSGKGGNWGREGHAESWRGRGGQEEDEDDGRRRRSRSRSHRAAPASTREEQRPRPAQLKMSKLFMGTADPFAQAPSVGRKLLVGFCCASRLCGMEL